MIIRTIKFHHFVYTLLVLAACSCSNTKYLPKGEVLYTGAAVTVKSPEISAKYRKTLASDLKTLTRPKPNSNFLGLRIKLWLWNIAGNPKKKNSPKRWIKNMGEPPVLLSSVSVENNAKILQNNLENQGFFRAQVTGDTVVKRQRARAIYQAVTGPQYTINDVFFIQDSSRVGKAIVRTQRRTLLKKGAPFNLQMIKDERARIDGRLKEYGYYFFKADYILIDVDSTIGDNKVNLYVRNKEETPPEAENRYRIEDVYIYSNYSLNTTIGQDTNKANAIHYRGYYVLDSSQKYKPRLFQQAMQFNPGDVYNRRDHNNSLNRLINLNVFKFVKNRFEKTGDTTLDVYYYLTPSQRKSLRLEIGGNTKSNNLAGSEVTVGFTNRNTFRGGEILRVDAFVGSEVQFSGQFKGYNTFRIGAEANLAFPRFIVPFTNIDPKGGFVPRTNVQLGYEILVKQKLYTLNSFKTGWGYLWKENIQKEHQFYPISVQYVQPINVTQEYLDSLAKDPTLQKAIDTQFIIGANYNYLVNGLAGKTRPANGMYFSGTLDLSGNIVGLAMGANAKEGDQKRIFGGAFAQYLKAEADFRVYRRLGRASEWANRIIVGTGFPYGNSLEMPFVKQYFVGGNNSLRAFRSRAIGPGTYIAEGYGTTGFVPDQSGDLKLELNTEYRMKLYSVIHGAVFVDAGNIWLYNENPLKPGGKFSKDWYRELAVGTGIGIRLDISIMVLRLDVAFPIRKPWLPEGERWVFKDIDLGSTDWRRQNVIYNLAIGYPF